MKGGIKINNGKKLELNFVINLNNHYIHELNLNLQKFIKFIFKDFDYSQKIYCKKLDNHQKADIYIKHNNKIKYISLKSGNQNSVHVEKIIDFTNFLIQEKIPKSIIDCLLLYHYGDDSITGDGKRRYSAENCKTRYKNQIFELNKYMNNSSSLTRIIERFILIGSNSYNKYVDIIYYGDIDIGIWCSSQELLNYCKKHKGMYINTPHFSVFTYQNWCRNTTFKAKSESHRNYIQIKWFSLLGDINNIRKTNDLK